MKLPFVSRRAYENLSDALARTIESETKWVERYDALLVRYDAATQKPDAPVLKERTRDEVIEAIMMKAGNNGQVRAHLAAWAMRQRREHVPDDQIIEQILVWGSPSDDDPSAGVP